MLQQTRRQPVQVLRQALDIDCVLEASSGPASSFRAAVSENVVVVAHPLKVLIGARAVAFVGVCSLFPGFQKDR